MSEDAHNSNNWAIAAERARQLDAEALFHTLWTTDDQIFLGEICAAFAEETHMQVH